MAKLSDKEVLVQAEEFVAECEKYGFSWSVRGDSIVTITKEFTPGDKQAFGDCDTFCHFVLSRAPLKGGSVWGTDGGGVGGYVALERGRFEMNKSGEKAVRFLNALKAIKEKQSRKVIAEYKGRAGLTFPLFQNPDGTFGYEGQGGFILSGYSREFIELHLKEVEQCTIGGE